ncbi:MULTISPECIES: NrsF family protein [unclassified Variovorax]
MAGGAGAAVYALHCPELAASFLAIWYVAGMTLPVLAGAAIGHRLLRW